MAMRAPLAEYTGLARTEMPEDPWAYPFAYLWRMTAVGPWHLVVWDSSGQEEGLDIRLGRCTCHKAYDCPAKTQHVMARNILAGRS